MTAEGEDLREGGELSDLVPTALDLLGLEGPPEMTGKSLIKRIDGDVKDSEARL